MVTKLGNAHIKTWGEDDGSTNAQLMSTGEVVNSPKGRFTAVYGLYKQTGSQHAYDYWEQIVEQYNVDMRR